MPTTNWFTASLPSQGKVLRTSPGSLLRDGQTPDALTHGRPRDRPPILTEPEVAQDGEHDDHDADDGEDVHVLPRFVLWVC
jgi:hypothetical protein